MKPMAQFLDWVVNKLPQDLANGARVGQSYMNHCCPTESDPQLFYETDVAEAWLKINEKESEKHQNAN
jgi:hypothetical protein